MSSMRALMGAGVKSVQYGSVSIASGNTSANATVSAVNTAKSVLNFLGLRTPEIYMNTGFATLTLAGSTTVTAARNVGGTDGVIVNFCLVEYY